MEMRLIDANKIPNYKYNVCAKAGDKESLCEFRVAHWKDIQAMPTIDPETLPIVQATKAMCREMIKENRELSKQLDISRRRSGDLSRELERVTRERDEAVEQLRGDCEKCSHYKVTWNGCTPDYECPLSDRCLNRDMWEWKGWQEED